MYLLLFVLSNVYYSKCMDPSIVDLLTPDQQQGEACGYHACTELKSNMDLYIHVVPYSHNELGYTSTFDGHYTGRDNYVEPSAINVKRILDYTISELWSQPHRTFTYSDMAYFFHWWSNRDETIRRMVYQLLRQGRLFFIGGGWSMTDEATTSYHAIIDHFTYTLRKINATFLECGRPLVAWQADVLGHSREFASLMAQMGFDGLFINPISFDDELPRMRRKDMEFVWRGSDDLGAESDIYTHKLYDGYWPPPGFCFGSQCKDPLIITSSKTFGNVIERVDEFVKLGQERQMPYYKTKHIMVIMGMRDGYYDASNWYRNLDRLMLVLNTRYRDVQALYSTPACYLKTVYDSSPQLQTKQDDFFPFAYDKNSYAAGMYTSRPSIKHIAREINRYLQIAKQVQVMAQLGNNDRVFEEYNWINGAFQDHNIITGEMRHYVVKYYVHRMNLATRAIADHVLEKGFNKLRNNTVHQQTLVMCKFNISRCHCTTGKHFYIVVYNPLPWPVTMPIRLPMYQVNQLIFDPNGKKLRAGHIELPKPVQGIPERQSNINFELVFIAEDLPPMGIRSYYLQRSGWERPTRSVKSRRKIRKQTLHKKRTISNDDINIHGNLPLPDYEYFDDENRETLNTEIDNVTTIKYENKGEIYKHNLETTTEYANMTCAPRCVELTAEKEESTTKFISLVTRTTSENYVTTVSDVTTSSDATTEVSTKKFTTENFVTFGPVTTESELIKTTESNAEDEIKTTEFNVKHETGTESVPVMRAKAELGNRNDMTTKAEMRGPTFLSDKAKDYNVPKSGEAVNDDDKYDYWDGYWSYIINDQNFIRNRFTRVNFDRNKRVKNIAIANGIKIKLNIEMYYYVSDDPKKMDRSSRPPGAYIFRTMDSKAEFFKDYEANVYKNQVVQEIHINFTSWASLSLRLYSHSPVVEVDWLVGPIPITDGLGKEILIKYSTNLTNDGVFYTDSNGRQTLKRIRDKRPTHEPVNKDPIAGNFYPVTSKIYIEDLSQNVRFAILNDRSQAGSSLKDGEINMLLHRRLLTEDGIQEAALNETEHGQGTVIRGQHYIYVSKADHKPYRVFEKKLAKEIELRPQILTSPHWGFGVKGKPIWMSQRNEFSGLKTRLPIGVHILTLEQWNDNGLLLRLENFLEKSDCVYTGVKKVYLKDLFSFIEILGVKETTLSAHMFLKDWVPLQWRKGKFVKNFNEGYGTNKFEYVNNESRVLQEVDLNSPIVLTPQQIRTFVVQFRYVNSYV